MKEGMPEENVQPEEDYIVRPEDQAQFDKNLQNAENARIAAEQDWTKKDALLASSEKSMKPVGKLLGVAAMSSVIGSLAGPATALMSAVPGLVGSAYYLTKSASLEIGALRAQKNAKSSEKRAEETYKEIGEIVSYDFEGNKPKSDDGEHSPKK